jgi:hypothetical protein
MNYAVMWTDGGPVYAGKLELGDGDIVLEARGGSGETHRVRLMRPLTGLRIARDAKSRLDGRPVLVLNAAEGALRLASLDGSGVLLEVAERLGMPRGVAAA